MEIPNAEDLDDVELEEAVDGLGAFGFVRIEDGAFSKASKNDFFFVTTGGNAAAGNELGRLYHLRLNGTDPTFSANLTVVYNADLVIAAGGDTAISPDNIDTSRDYLMVQEDGTSPSRPVMAAKGRDGGIWRFDLLQDTQGRTMVDATSGRFIAELDPPGADGVPVTVPGTWESSGIIDAAELLGTDAWIVDVQAHSPTTAPGLNTVEDGQLLIISRDD